MAADKIKQIVSIVVCCLCLSIQAQYLGVPQMTTFPVERYGAGGQNYQVEISQDGVVYVANNFGLLRFDGSNWKRFEIPGGTKVRSLWLGEKNRIYIGAQNELGFFEVTEEGGLEYFTLVNKLPATVRNFEDVWKIISFEEGLAFVTDGQSFFYQDEQMSTEITSDEPGFAHLFEGTILTQSKEGVLHIYEDAKWQLLNEQPPLADLKLVTTFEIESSSRLWFTRNGGIVQSRQSEHRAFAANYAKQLAEATITTATKLQSNEIAVGTQSSGLFIFSQEGSLVYHFNKDNGFSSLTVHDIKQDDNGALWVSLNNSIVKIHWNYPFSFLDKQVGVPGTGYAATEYRDQLYLGTNNGLYITEKYHGRVGGVAKFGQLNGQINNVQVVNDQLIVSADEGIYQRSNNGIVPIDRSVGWWTMKQTKNPVIALGGSYEGVGLFVFEDNTWQLKKIYPEFAESSRVMCFDQQGYLWVAHGYKGIYRLAFSPDFERLEEVKYFGVEQGLTSLYLNNVFEVSGSLVFGSERGLFQFDYENEIFERHPYFDTLIGPEVHTRVIEENTNGDIYILTNQYCGVLIKDQWTGYRLEKNLFNAVFPLMNNDLAQISMIDGGEVIFTANQGFIQYKANTSAAVSNPQIRLTSVGLLHSGKKVHAFYSENESLEFPLTLPYAENAVSFSFTSLQDPFNNPSYRYRLLGFRDEEWSSWSSQNNREFTNLFEGDYAFEVKSRDVFLNESTPIRYHFKIAPPWYRSTAAYVGYIFLFVSTFFVSFYAYRRKYKKERTLLIEGQQREISKRDTALTQLRNEKLETEISHKKKQLASSTMHLLDKNDLLSKLKSQIKALTELEKMDAQAKRELRRMVKEIDQNIDKDKSWEQFELHFDEVHGDFLKRISQEYSKMTPQEIKLAAYLRMNMTTKEIANLLKISVRGVEIARYRLRKKLNLDQGQNLVDFMLKY